MTALLIFAASAALTWLAVVLERNGHGRAEQRRRERLSRDLAPRAWWFRVIEWNRL